MSELDVLVIGLFLCIVYLSGHFNDFLSRWIPADERKRDADGQRGEGR